MKPTGIVRKIDELGRIVIPIEIRKTLRIKESDSIEIYTSEDSIILKKFSKIQDILDYINTLITKAYRITENNIIVTDRESIIAAIGKETSGLKSQIISKQLIDIIKSHEGREIKERTIINISENNSLNGSFAIIPLTVDSDVTGLIIIHNNNYDTNLKLLAKFIATLIEDEMDISKI